MTLEGKLAPQENKDRIPESLLLRLNAAHYKMQLRESELAHVQRAMQDTQNACVASRNEVHALLEQASQLVGFPVGGWDMETGAIQPMPQPGQTQEPDKTGKRKKKDTP